MSESLTDIALTGVLVGGRFSTIDQLGNLSPTVANPISNQSATVDSVFTFQFPSNTFSDPNGDTLTYSATLSGGGALPSWLTFTSGTRTFSGTPLLANVGTIAVTVTANDGNGGTASDTFEIVTAEAGVGTLIARADWSLHGLTPTTIAGYEATTSWFVFDAGSTIVKENDYAKASYVDSSGGQTNCGVTLFLDSLNVAELFIEFQARIPTATKNGNKFYKVFGVDTGGDYSNHTFGLVYSGGEMAELSFGDGTPTGNDTHSVIRLNGSNPEYIGRSFGTAVVTLGSPAQSFNWDSNWHTFRFHHKYNTGTSAANEVADGEFDIYIDGVLKLQARNVFNRHPTANVRRIDRVEFFGYNQNSSGAWEMNIRNIKVSTGGWV